MTVSTPRASHRHRCRGRYRVKVNLGGYIVKMLFEEAAIERGDGGQRLLRMFFKALHSQTTQGAGANMHLRRMSFLGQHCTAQVFLHLLTREAYALVQYMYQLLF